ncbi:hypothetical protein [Paucisalibacillus sp. EB02]|uniref:hypothetical protein n=1 Tax=Paucisalibacillus sp. EB02 TaxID=1347087 RepID=UPI0004B40681|nr:hypothetical protein [Paucisalibacillus sp. EB02]
MKQNAIYLKVAVDMFTAQSLWVLGFLGVMIVVHIFRIVSSLFGDFEVDTYFNSVFISANIAMFVIGILCFYFLPHFVANGVTRKDYFKGATLAAIGLSVFLPIITIVFSVLSQFIINQIDGITINNPDINSVVQDIDTDGNIIGNIISSTVQSFIVPPYIDPNSNWLLAISIVSINIFIYYLIGWMISSGFYRLGTVPGLCFVFVGLIILIAKDSLLRITLDLPLVEQLKFLDILPKSIAAITVFLLIIMVIGITRLLTKQVTVKL